MAARWNASIFARDPYAATAAARCFGDGRRLRALPGATRIIRSRLAGRSAARNCANFPPIECPTSATGASIDASAARRSEA